METKLAPIFKLRTICLQKISPNYYKSHEALIKRTSLAAQDYVLSGKIYEYKPYMERNFKDLPEYIKIHEKYPLPFTPDKIVLPVNGVNPGLVMDLSWSFEQDKLHSIIDSMGNIINPKKIYYSEVLKVYHNSSASGIPADAIQTVPKNIVMQIIKSAQKVR